MNLQTITKLLFVVSFSSLTFPLGLNLEFASAQEPTQDNANASQKKKTELSISEQLEKATRKVTSNQKYKLEYKFQKGQNLYYQVEHFVLTDTAVQGVKQGTNSRAVATTNWSIKDIERDGTATVVLTTLCATMQSQEGDAAIIKFDSQSDEAPPAKYAAVAKTIGKPYATYQVRPDGKIHDKEVNFLDLDLGLREFILVLPEKPVSVGYEWAVESHITVKDEGRPRRIKTQKRYSLNSVKNGVASIGMETEVLSIVNDPKLMSQIIQKLKSGTIKFDLEMGQIVSKKLKWDQSVIGFVREDSMTEYVAQRTEKLLDKAPFIERFTTRDTFIKAPSHGPIFRD